MLFVKAFQTSIHLQTDDKNVNFAQVDTAMFSKPTQDGSQSLMSKVKQENTSSDSAINAFNQAVGECTETPYIETSGTKLLEHEQFIQYAKQIEEARISLMQLMLKDHLLLHLFAKEYMSRFKKHDDMSDIFTLTDHKVNAYPVQEDIFVQGSIKQVETDLSVLCQEILNAQKLDITQYQDAINTIQQIHFLPVFMMSFAEKAVENEGVNSDHKFKLRSYLETLKILRKLLIETNLRLVTYVAKQYLHSKMPFSDLIQEGTVGLIKAIDRYDYRRGVKFSSYAIYWIRQTISRSITSQKKSIRLPYNLAPKASLVFHIINKNLQETNKWPSSQKLAQECDLQVHEVEMILEFYQPSISLSSHVNNDEEMPSLIETIAQTDFPLPFSSLAKTGLEAVLQQSVNALPEREAYVLCARYGVNNSVEMTLQDIADQLHISRERVRQIQNTALKRIKKLYGNELCDFLIPDMV